MGYEAQERYLKETLKDVAKDLRYLRKNEDLVREVFSLVDENKEEGTVYSANMMVNGSVNFISFDIHTQNLDEETVMEILIDSRFLLQRRGYTTKDPKRSAYFDGKSLKYSITGNSYEVIGDHFPKESIKVCVISHSPKDCELMEYKEEVTKYKLDCGKEAT